MPHTACPPHRPLHNPRHSSAAQPTPDSALVSPCTLPSTAFSSLCTLAAFPRPTPPSRTYTAPCLGRHLLPPHSPSSPHPHHAQLRFQTILFACFAPVVSLVCSRIVLAMTRGAPLPSKSVPLPSKGVPPRPPGTMSKANGVGGKGSILHRFDGAAPLQPPRPYLYRTPTPPSPPNALGCTDRSRSRSRDTASGDIADHHQPQTQAPLFLWVD